MWRYMRKKELYKVIFLLILLGLLYYGIFVLQGKDFYLISLSIIVIGLMGFLLSFEKKRPGAALLTVVSSLCALAVASRILFFFLPQIKPMAAVVIIAGVVFGPETGFVTGAVSAFVSNFYFGQGSWTPFQMFALGMVGYFAGVFFRGSRNRILVMIYGFFSVVVLYGGIVEINSVYFSLGESVTAEAVAGIYLAALPFNLLFGVSTAVFLFFLYRPILKHLERLDKKYCFIDKGE